MHDWYKWAIIRKLDISNSAINSLHLEKPQTEIWQCTLQWPRRPFSSCLNISILEHTKENQFPRNQEV